MKRMTWARPLIGAAVMATLGLAAQAPAFAGPEEDILGLKMASAISKDRFFVRAGGIYIKVRTKSSDTYDVTGPILIRDELRKVTFADDGVTRTLYSGLLPPTVGGAAGVPLDTSAIASGQRSLLGSDAQKNAATNALRGDLGIKLLTEIMLPKSQSQFPDSPSVTDAGITSLGTPRGIKSEAAKEMGTAGVSLGYFLSDDHTWVAEAYVLAAPLRTSATVRGLAVNTAAIGDQQGDDNGLITRPIAIDGQRAVTSKLIPPTVLFGRYFGAREAFLRPYLGLNATYAIFYDTKATQTLNSYVGGTSPGDTTVSLKNAFGIGPVVGFKVGSEKSPWHASLNVGYTRLKTTASIITRNTFLTKDTAAIYDLGPVSGTINAASNALDESSSAMRFQGGTVAAISRVLAGARNNASCGKDAAGNVGSCLGTYERRQDLTLDNTLFLLSVGRSF